MALRWEATSLSGALSPVLDADISLIPAGSQETRLALAGAYRPPLDGVGTTLDSERAPGGRGNDPHASGTRRRCPHGDREPCGGPCLGRGEFNRDIQDAQVRQAARHTPGPREQRQRCTVVCFDDRAQPPDRRWALVHQRRAECRADAASLPVVGNGDRDVGGARITGILQEMGDPDRPLLALWRQHDKQERNVMHPVGAVDKPPDHRVIEFPERRKEPALARIRRQTAETLAQRPGIRSQQRPDQRRRAIPQKELPRKHVTALLPHSRAARLRKTPRRLRLHIRYNAPALPASS